MATTDFSLLMLVLMENGLMVGLGKLQFKQGNREEIGQHSLTHLISSEK